MSNDDAEKVFSAISKENSKHYNENKEHKISGILYLDDSNWTVWIDNIPYSSIGQKKNFR